MEKLSLPTTLAELLEEISEHQPVHSTAKNVTHVSQRVTSWPNQKSLPENINDYPFSKFADDAFAHGNWGYSSKPSERPLLKTTEQTNKHDNNLNYLVLQYMKDKNLKGKWLKLFADYIICLAQGNSDISDELLCQVVSQTWKNHVDDQHERIWRFLSHCLSSVVPSLELYPYILKYVSDKADDYFQGHFQSKLLQISMKNRRLDRLLPTTALEWEANNNCCKMALEIIFPDDSVAWVGIGSWSTTSDVAKQALKIKGLHNMPGWSVSMEMHSGITIEASADDYIMDLVSNIEAFPSLRDEMNLKAYFLEYEQEKPVYAEIKQDLGRTPSRKTGQISPPSPLQELAREHAIVGQQRSARAPSRQISASGSGTGGSNFSFGPPNLAGHGGRRESTQPSRDVTRRLKGGGSMYQSPMYMPAMQQPMMQPVMQPQPMMPSSYPTYPPMQMAQPTPMQMAQPTPMQMAQPAPMQMAQPAPMQMPQTSPMFMPSSVGMMSNGMDPVAQRQMLTQQQMMLQQQMQMLVQQSMKQQESLNQLVRNNEKSLPSTSGNHFSRRDSSYSQEDREWPTPSQMKHNTVPPAVPPVAHMKEAAKPFPAAKHTFSAKVAEKPVKTAPLLSSEDIENISLGVKEDGQGTVKMSFQEKRKFFLLKQIESDQPKLAAEKPLRKKLWDSKEVTVVPVVTSLPQPDKPEPKKVSVVKAERLSKQETAAKNENRGDILKMVMEAKKASNKQTTMKAREVTPPVESASKEKIGLAPSRKIAEALKAARRPTSRSPREETNMAMKKLISDKPEKRPSVIVGPLEAQPSMLLPALLHDHNEDDLKTSERKDSVADVDIQTMSHSTEHHPIVTYKNVPWKLRLRKESILPVDTYENTLYVGYLYKQIACDVGSSNPRLLDGERQKIVEMMAKQDANTMSGKRVVVEYVVENCKIYFSKLFLIKITGVTDESMEKFSYCDIVAVGRSGLNFMSADDISWKPHSINFSDINDVYEETSRALCVVCSDGSLYITSRKGQSLRKAVQSYWASYQAKMKKPTAIAAPTDRPSIHKETQKSKTEKKAKKISSGFEIQPPPDDGAEYSLLAYAKQYFRKPDQASKMISYSKNPMKKSLIKFTDDKMNAVAVRCFKIIMKFTRDADSNSSEDVRNILELFAMCKKNPRIVDEVFVQMVKQTNQNKYRECCIRAWRLLAFVSAFLQPSKFLVPHLSAHLHGANEIPETANASAVVLVNLQQTLNYGGRKELPTDMEIMAVANGHVAIDQVFVLPGAVEWRSQLATSTVVSHVIESFAKEHGISDQEDAKEYGIFLVVMAKDQVNNIITLPWSAYVMDINSDMRRQNVGFFFMIQRVVWSRPVQMDNSKLVSIFFQQLSPDYVDGKLVDDVTEVMSKRRLGEVARTVALLYVGFERKQEPTVEEVVQFVPRPLQTQQDSTVWNKLINKEVKSIKSMSAHQARCEFLKSVMRHQLYGSSFFNVDVTTEGVEERACIFAVSYKGLRVIDAKDLVMDVLYKLSDVTSVELSSPNICDIVLETSKGDTKFVKVKSTKALLISGVINRHITCKQ